MRQGRLRGLMAGILILGAPLLAADARHEAQRLIDSGEPEQAIAVLSPWIRENPKDAQAWLLRSTAHFVLGRAESGRVDLERALSLEPSLRQAWLNKGAVDLADRNYKGALEAFGRAEELAPDEPDNSLNIGTVLLLGGDLSGASDRFRRYLERNSGSAEAYYLVASNYGMVGQVAMSRQALEYAIQLDEKTRRRARVDPNLAEVSRDQRFRDLLETDNYRPPTGSWTAVRRFDAAYTGRDSRLLDAVIRALQLTAEPFDPQIEVAERWALLWASFRIKIQYEELAKSRIELSAPPQSYEAQDWETKTDAFFDQVTIQLFGLQRGVLGPKENG